MNILKEIQIEIDIYHFFSFYDQMSLHDKIFVWCYVISDAYHSTIYNLDDKKKHIAAIYSRIRFLFKNHFSYLELARGVLTKYLLSFSFFNFLAFWSHDNPFWATIEWPSYTCNIPYKNSCWNMRLGFIVFGEINFIKCF